MKIGDTIKKDSRYEGIIKATLCENGELTEVLVAWANTSQPASWELPSDLRKMEKTE